MAAAQGGAPGGRPAPAPRRTGPIATAFPLRFDSEIIRLRIVEDSLEVDGTYFLACQSAYDSPISLFYPFPRDSLLAGARMVSGETRVARGPWSPLRWEDVPRASGVRWWAPPCPGDTVEIHCLYRQAIRTAYARYIVTTTRAWQQPIRHARFEIRLPAGATPVEFSFPFAESRDSTGVVYVWETEEFFPDQDIVVRWQ